jgi:RhtB (resistance to homoserine/threonine) family protein|tara:strand:+ start:1020 stop:1622 length:603 start_codon:yes stop_codon:yes gene_type:complete
VLEFLTIAILHLFAVASPGPDFLLVTRQSLKFGRSVAIWSSAGIATGILFHSFIAITGVSLIISSNPNLFDWLKVCAAIYIAYLGCLSFFSKSRSSKDKDGRKNEKHFGAYILGLITNILNPKAILFFVTVYTAVVNESTTKPLLSFYGLYMSVTTFIWFSCISYIFSNQAMTNKYQNFIPIFEKVIGIILIIIAIQLFL